MKSSKSVEEYIEGLTSRKEEISLLRDIILSTGLDEGIKWGAPCYSYQGKNVAGLAAFKSYAGIWFFQGGLLEDKNGYLINAQEGVTKAMRQWRFASVDEIRSSPVADYIYESIENFRQGNFIRPGSKSQDFDIPEDLATAIEKETMLVNVWNSFAPSHRREYAAYVAEAKREETKLRRIEKVLGMLRNKQGLNDKYKK